jgi:hypothetical protein
VLLFLACGSSNPTSPTGGGGAAPPPTYTVALQPANEVPAITNADASGSGSATITLNVTRETAGNITAATAEFQVTLSGFPAGTSLTGAHIHEGVAGQSGSVKVSLGLSAGDVTLPNGSGSFSRTGISVDPALAQAIVNNPAGYYFNVHTLINPSGAARGQL